MKIAPAIKYDRQCLTASECEDINEAVNILRKGGVILYPTDTVWGLGCDATNPKAVERVYEIKHRSDSKALITLVGHIRMLEKTVDGIPDVAYQLLEYSTKPLTIIYDRGINVAPNLLAADGSLAVRIPHDNFAAELCKSFGKPLVSTSANFSGENTPHCFSEINPDLFNFVDYICTTARTDTRRKTPSSIIRLCHNGLFTIIRP